MFSNFENKESDSSITYLCPWITEGYLCGFFFYFFRKDGDEVSVASGTDSWDVPLVKVASEQKRTKETSEPDSGCSEQIEVQALLVHKVLHKSQAAIRRDVQLQWRVCWLHRIVFSGVVKGQGNGEEFL